MQKYLYYLSSIFELLTGLREWPMVLLVFLGRAPKGPKLFHLRRSGLAFTVRGPMDLWSLKEAFIDRFYEHYGTRIEDGWTVVDIGAGIGEFTLFAADHHPTNRVYAFEPFSESYDLLCQNVANNHLTNISTFTEAIWSRSGALALDLSGGEPLQLQSQADLQGLAPDGHRQVQSLSLSDALARLKLGRVDLLKLDCEGAEYPILLEAPDSVLDRIQRIVMEYHDNIPAHKHTELTGFLQRKGYRVTAIQNQVHDYLGYLYAARDYVE